MKNKKVSTALLAAGFCASTMMACGVYGAPERPDVQSVTETEGNNTVFSTEPLNDESETINNETDSENESETINSETDSENDTEYAPDRQEETSVYGAPEDFE